MRESDSTVLHCLCLCLDAISGRVRWCPGLLTCPSSPHSLEALARRTCRGRGKQRDHPINQEWVMSKPRVVFPPCQSAVSGQRAAGN